MLLSSKYTQQDTPPSVTARPPQLTCSARLAATPLAQSPFSRRARFSDQGRGGHRGCAADAPWRLSHSHRPPQHASQLTAQLAVQLTAQQCTQMTRNGAKRPFSPICVHYCVPTSTHNGATVYTNALKRTREAVLADLCTLLRPPPTPARATGRGHGSHDTDGPMAPVMPGRSDLRTTPPER